MVCSMSILWSLRVVVYELRDNVNWTLHGGEFDFGRRLVPYPTALVKCQVKTYFDITIAGDWTAYAGHTGPFGSETYMVLSDFS
jgi:hypothetical protein